MIKKIFTILLITLVQTISSQETILTFNNVLKKSSSDIKDVIPIVNNDTGEIAFFVADAKNVYGYKIDASFKIKGKITSSKGEVLPFASVIIKGTSIGTTSDENGLYELKSKKN